MGVESVRDFITDAIGYVKAVFVDGIQWVFTFFDILGLAIFFYKDLARMLTTDESVMRVVGGSLLLLSFTLANFTVYRKLAKRALVIVFPNNLYTEVGVRNLGPGTIRDLKVSILYCDENGKQTEDKVQEFFSDDALGHRGDLSVLVPKQAVHFRLPHKDSVAEQKVEVWAQFTVVESGRAMQIREEMSLEDQQWPRARVY